MTIWLLTLVLLASLAGLGYRQGLIRVAFSLLGILFGLLLAVPLGKLLKPVFPVFGLKNPVLIWALGPLLMFVLVSLLFKFGGLAVHQKVDVYYKYKVGDLRLALWERLYRRLGLCLGLVNGTLYLILIAFLIYAVSYWTLQLASSEGDARAIRWVNQLGRDLDRTGFVKVARAVARLSPAYYEAADFVGLIYHNPLSEARLSRYPGFLSLAERPEFHDLGTDTEFANMRARQEPIRNVLDYPKIQGIVGNPDELKLIWDTVQPDLSDAQAYLATGKSAKYDSEKILGRWLFDVNTAISMVRRARPNLPSREMQNVRRYMAAAFVKTSLVAMPDHHAVLKNVPPSRTALPSGQPGETETLPGQWKLLDANKYEFTFAGATREETLTGIVEDDRLTLRGEGLGMPFNRED